jgi:hypothetical protein
MMGVRLRLERMATMRETPAAKFAGEREGRIKG